MSDEINKLAEENIKDVLENGPGLRYSRNTWIVAKDPKRNRILVGGLGGLGVGQMWFDETPDHKNYPGYDEAPEAEGDWTK